MDITEGSVSDILGSREKDLQSRWREFGNWCERRQRGGVFSYEKVQKGPTGPTTDMVDGSGNRIVGPGFANQDYLSLSNHPAIIDAAIDAAQTFGVHSAGSTALAGLPAIGGSDN